MMTSELRPYGRYSIWGRGKVDAGTTVDRPANQVYGPGRLCLHIHRRDTSAEPPSGVQPLDPRLLSSDLAMVRSLPPEAATPAYLAQNETCCRSTQRRISELATGPSIAEKGGGRCGAGGHVGTGGERRKGQRVQIVQNLPGSTTLACGRNETVMNSPDRAPYSSPQLLRPIHSCSAHWDILRL